MRRENTRYTLNWGDVPGDMEDPVSCPIIATTEGLRLIATMILLWVGMKRGRKRLVKKEKEVNISSWARRTMGCKEKEECLSPR
jgi:hypothetical protein